MRTTVSISRKFKFTATSVSMLCIMGARPAKAQLGLESLLSSITDIDVSFTCWSTGPESIRKADCPGRKNGYGVEVLWAVTKLPVLGGRRESGWTTTERTRTKTDGGEQIAEKQVQVDSVRGNKVVIELGLGYSQFSGFESTDPRYELSGAVREIPSVAIYATLEGPGVLDHVQPYFGVRSGLIQLKGVQALVPIGTDSTAVYSGGGEVFQVGVAPGVAFGGDRLNFFIEGNLNLRKFASVQWNGGAGARVPSYLPQSLDFTGKSVSIGVQIHVRDPKP